MFETQKLQQHNLVDAAIEAMGALSAQIAWSAYSSLLAKYLRLVKDKPDMEKTLLRVIIAVLDGFHFNNAPAVVVAADLAEDGDEPGEEVGVEIETVVSAGDEAGEAAATEPEASAVPEVAPVVVVASATAAVIETQRGTLPANIHSVIVAKVGCFFFFFFLFCNDPHDKFFLFCC